MNMIKFSTEHISQSRFAATVRENVNKYFKENGISTKGNAALVVQTLIMLSVYAVPFVVILILPMTSWMALFLSGLMGIGVAGVGMCAMHDAVHGSYSRHDWVNKVVGGTMYLLGGNVISWKIQHNILHHTYTNIDGQDEDIASRGPIRLSENSPLRKFHRYKYIHAFFFYGLMTISKLTKDFKQLAAYNRSGITRQLNINPVSEYFKMVLVKAIYLFVMIGLPVLFTAFAWWQVLIGFFVMHFIASAILSTVFQLAHVVEGTLQPMPNGEGLIENQWHVHELLTTSDFARNNKLLTWYVGGLNFQIEHHLFPNICHIHYKQIAPIVEKTAKEYGLKYNLKPSFRNAIVSHIKRLKALGKTAV